MPYQVPLIFHPTLHVADLDGASTWVSEVFGRDALRWNERWDFSKINSDYPLDYSFLFHIGDTLVDVFAPTLYRLPDMPVPPAPEKDKLVDVAWWTDDASQLMEHLDKNGIRATDQSGQPIVGAMVPESFLAPDSYLLWTNPEDSGLAYEFMEIGAQHREYYSKKADPRLAGGTIPRPADDPLGIVKTSHHTILTNHPARALRYFTEIFDGTILHKGHNKVLDTDSTYIQFTDGVFEIAVPHESSEYSMYLESEKDHYLGIAFLVSDLSLAASRFDATNVSYEIKGGMVVTQPKSSLGVQWGFTDKLPYA